MTDAMSDASGGGAHAAPVTDGSAYGTSGSTSAATSGIRDSADVSIGQLINNISTDLSTLMRQEVALAKAELKQEASKAAKGAGMLGGAGFAGYLTVLFLSIALWAALAAPVGAGWAALIVAALWGLVAAVLFVLGRQRLQQVNPKLEQTVETVSEIPSALKPN